MADRAVVIGGGFGGIAAAIRMKAKGYDVTLIDRCDRLGGRAQVFERDGFRFDAGPTVITAPFLFEELFELLGERMSDHVKLVPLDPWYRFRFPDGTYFNYGGSVEDTLEEIRRISPEDCSGYLNLVAESKEIYGVGFEQLADQPFDRFTDMMKLIPQLVPSLSLRCWSEAIPLIRRAFIRSSTISSASGASCLPWAERVPSLSRSKG
jgi:phytoene desaturase